MWAEITYPQGLTLIFQSTGQVGQPYAALYLTSEISTRQKGAICVKIVSIVYKL